MKKKNITHKTLFIILIVSLLVFVCWFIYIQYFSINKLYVISTDELKANKVKVIELKIPIFKNKIDIVSYSINSLCRDYLQKNIEIVLEYKNNKFIVNKRKVLYDLKYNNIIKIKILTKKPLKSCLFKIESLPTKSDVFLAIICGYGALMLFLISLLILIYRYLTKYLVRASKSKQ